MEAPELALTTGLAVHNLEVQGTKKENSSFSTMPALAETDSGLAIPSA